MNSSIYYNGRTVAIYFEQGWRSYISSKLVFMLRHNSWIFEISTRISNYSSEERLQARPQQTIYKRLPRISRNLSFYSRYFIPNITSTFFLWYFCSGNFQICHSLFSNTDWNEISFNYRSSSICTRIRHFTSLSNFLRLCHEKSVLSVRHAYPM